ncbi:MAG: DUF86 domain-containing protein [Actinobacteria bacterium]|nr:DUF86 domain-containing protein [Actinomycetota bacterium]
MVDPGRVAALLERVGAEVKAIRQSTERPDEDLHSDNDALPAMKYRLVVAIETTIDIADHIIASEGMRPAQSFADSFAALEEGGWVDGDLAGALQEAARFRNLLVHQYADVDDDRVVETARTRLNDLETYCTTIARRLA